MVTIHHFDHIVKQEGIFAFKYKAKEGLLEDEV